MKFGWVLICYVSLVMAVSASESTPQGVRNLTTKDADYGVVLFHYFRHDYQQALKEISLVNPDTLNSDEREAHQYFLNVLHVANGIKTNSASLNMADNASIQAVMLAVNGAIETQQWAQARELLNILSPNLPAQFSNQFQYLLGQLAFADNNEQKLNNAMQSVQRQSIQFAMMAQYQSVLSARQSKISEPLLTQAKNIDASQYLGIKDHTLLSLGYGFLNAGNSPLAIDSFKQISLASPIRNKAALGLGLAFNQSQEYGLALQVLENMLEANDPGVIAFDAKLAQAFALEKLGDEFGAYQHLNTGLQEAKLRLQTLPTLKERLFVQSDCIANLLTNIIANNCDLDGEELNETLLISLATRPFLLASQQIQDIGELEIQFNQQLQSIHSFHFLLTHQITQIETLLNKQKIEQLEAELDDTTTQRAALVTSVDDAVAAKDGHFFLSSKYLELESRINEAFKRMVFLKRAGQKNTASERRVTLLQRIVWWHSFSNLSKHIDETKADISELNQQLTNNNYAYQILQDYLSKVATMRKQLSKMALIKQSIDTEKAKLPVIRNEILDTIKQAFEKLFKQEKLGVEAFIVDAELAKVRIEDASFNRAFDKDEGLEK